MSDWTLCIDFGTAYSKAALAPRDAWTNFDPGALRPLTLSGHEHQGNAFLLDSAVFVDDDRILFGRSAIMRADAAPGKKRTALRSFKTLLSVSDLDRALNTNASLAIDPHRLFQMRDLIVLYLAYLLASVDRAISADPVAASASSIARRYAAPAWRSGDSTGLHASIVRLFGEAEALRLALGDKLLAPQGVPIKKVADTLPGAMGDPKRLDMSLVFEATAAAAYTSVGIQDAAAHLIVVDMGAGTTDIAAMSRAGDRVEEIPEARITLKQAGDLIDKVIANIVLEANASARGMAQQTELWRLLMTHMRDIKESLFLDGRAVLRHEGRTLGITMKELERDKDYRAFVKDVTQAYDESLRVVRDVAAARKKRGVHAIAVGGGAAAPFIQALLRRKPPRAGKLVIEPRPATPEWAFAPEFEGNLAPVFPQLAIAIGGALAPDAMMAARGASSPAVAARNGIRVERD